MSEEIQSQDKPKMGRPLPAPRELIQAKFIDALRSGCTVKDAAWCAGVPPSTIHNWRKSNRDFWIAVKEAQMTAKLNQLLKIVDAQDWKAAAWWLSHVFPDEFADRSHQTIDIKNPAIKKEADRQIRIFASKLHSMLPPEIREVIAAAIDKIEGEQKALEAGEAVPE